MTEYLEIVCRAGLGLVFVASAFGKVRNGAAFQAFRAGLATMRVVPPSLVASAAAATVAVEFAVPVLLSWAPTARFGLLLAGAAVCAFSGAIMVVLRAGTAAACPCFGRPSMRFGYRHLVRNGILLVLAGTGYLTGSRTDDITLGGVVLAVTLAFVLATLIVSFDEITDVLVVSPRGGAR